MDQRTQFLIQVLERLGAPLTMAVAASAQNAKGTDAQRVAELLNKSVQLGLSLAESMNVRDEAQADGVHLALAAFSGPLVAGQYMNAGRVPADLEIRRMSGAVQAVLSFADNFSPAADTTLRLENVEPGSEIADEMLVQVQMLNAFAPMLQAISQYTFGRQENKLVKEVSERIVQDAEDQRALIFGRDQAVRERRRSELVLTKMMAGIYAAAHVSEMTRLMGLSEQDRNAALSTGGGLSMDMIWANYERQVAMIAVLAETMIPARENVQNGRAASGGVKPAGKQPYHGTPSVTPPMTPPSGALPGGMPPIFTKNLPGKTAEAMVPQDKATNSAAESGAGGNPMAFFANKKQADGSS